MKTAREEAELVFSNVVGDLLKVTNTNPKDIDILVVNCSLFCPTPSLASMVRCFDLLLSLRCLVKEKLSKQHGGKKKLVLL